MLKFFPYLRGYGIEWSAFEKRGGFGFGGA